MQIRAGQRLSSTVCDTAVVVVRGGSEGSLDVRCGGLAMVPLAEGSDGALGTPEEGYDEGTLIGKRYWDEEVGVELMCTKSGVGSLSVGDRPLTLKPAKPLPSSD